MRAVYLSLCFVFFSLPLLRAEDGKPAPERRKRSRFLIYDVKPILIGKEGTEMPVEEEIEQEAATHEALKGIRLPSQPRQSLPPTSVTSVQRLPMMETRSAEEAEEDVEETSWVTPLDFMATEDLIVPEEELDVESQEESSPADWDALEQKLQQDQGVEEEIQKESSMEKEGHPFESESARTVVSTGLQLTSVLSEPTPALEAASGDSVLSDSPSEITHAAVENQAALEQSLPSAMNLGGQSVTPSLPESGGLRGLEGSRALFAEVRERWQPAAPTIAPESASPAASPLESSAVRSLGEIESRLPVASTSTVSRNIPAPVLRKERSFQPATADVSASIRSTRNTEPAREPHHRPALKGFQRRETGVRSRIGELPGMGRP